MDSLTWSIYVAVVFLLLLFYIVYYYYYGEDLSILLYTYYYSYYVIAILVGDSNLLLELIYSIYSLSLKLVVAITLLSGDDIIVLVLVTITLLSGDITLLVTTNLLEGDPITLLYGDNVTYYYDYLYIYVLYSNTLVNSLNIILPFPLVLILLKNANKSLYGNTKFNSFKNNLIES